MKKTFYIDFHPGMPYVYWIYAAYSARFTEQLRRRETPLTLTARIAENNRERVRGSME